MDGCGPLGACSVKSAVRLSRSIVSVTAEYVNDDRDACGNATLCQEAASTCTGLPWTTLAAIRIVESIGTTRVHDAGLFVLTRLRERL